MEPKFVIFAALSVLLVAAIYGSLAFVQFAFSAYKDYCAWSPDGKRWICIVISDKAGIYLTDCKEECIIAPLTRAATAGGSSLPSGLRDALDTAIVEFENTTNTTKSPKGPNIFDVLQEDLLEVTQNNTQNTSQRIVAPQDRFCVEGTGGDTGRECIPCDPGLRFEVGCIDILTGGPLDTAVQESQNDTIGPKTDLPKDLPLLEEDNDDNDETKLPEDGGGLKDKDDGPTINPDLP